MAGNKTKIYYQDSGYPIDRNLVNVPFDDFEPVKKAGLTKIISHIHYKLRGKSPLLGNSHWELMEKTDGLWHFFNSVSFGKTPWVVTYETALPRWNTQNKKLLSYGIRALAGAPCKKLIALSECTKSIQHQFLEINFPSFKEQISSKITVIHPPQELLITHYEEKNLPEDKLIFTFIGADFFRKGGKEVLTVFDRLLQDDQPVKLNIVSALQYDDYASRATEGDLRKAKEVIAKYPDSIHHSKRLPNTEVLELMKNSHIGLLPTYGDTYGYSVLEAQACGCPVITTNLRALPEINNGRCGWIIEVPKNSCGNGLVNSPEERSRFSGIITESLYEIIQDVLSSPAQVRRKGEASMNRIRTGHKPESVASRIEKIYQRAM